MKWLFAILVALNIIIFANVITQKMQQPKEVKAIEEVVVAPVAKQEEVIWDDAASQTEINASQEAAEQEHKAVKEGKKADKKTETAKRKEESINDIPLTRKAANCSAKVTLPEDAYHRLKGMLNRWPNAANRIVVKNDNTDEVGRQYHVLFPVNGDATEVAIEAISKGFKAKAEGNVVTLGIFKNQNHAEQLKDKARNAGYAQTNVIEKRLTGAQNLTTAKYQVLFLQVDNQAAKDIGDIVQPYSRLERSDCK